MIDELVPGVVLALVREPENPHDALAVRVEWNGTKLGYVPRALNAAIAAALDGGHVLTAHVHALEHEERWSPLTISIAAPP